MGRTRAAGASAGILALVGLALAARALAQPAGAAQPLALVGTDTLPIVGKPGANDATAPLFVVNQGSQTATITGVAFESAEGATVTVSAGTEGSSSVEVPAGKVVAVPLTFKGLGRLGKVLDGIVVLSAGKQTLARLVDHGDAETQPEPVAPSPIRSWLARDWPCWHRLMFPSRHGGLKAARRSGALTEVVERQLGDDAHRRVVRLPGPSGSVTLPRRLT
jgi:hypothetical protein